MPATRAQALDGLRVRQTVAVAATIEAASSNLPITPSFHFPRKALLAFGISTVAIPSLFVAAQALPKLWDHPATAPRAVSASAPTAATPAAPAPAPVPVPAIPMAQIQHALDTAASPSPISVVVTDLKTGQQAGTNPNQIYTSASLYKLYVAQAIYKMIDSGQLSLGSSAGNGLTISQCLTKMITVSDNPCGVALGKIVGWEKQNASLHQAGFVGTSLFRASALKTSAADVALLFKRLYEGTLLSPNSTQHFTTLLKAQKINDRIPAQLPTGTIIAHKTGNLNGLVHDAGIVYTPKGDYIISMMSGPWRTEAQASSTLAGLSSRVFKLVNP